MQVSIEETIKRVKGQTRYCNCDLPTCNHNNYDGEVPCPSNAVVAARIDGVSLQMCNECLKFARNA